MLTADIRGIQVCATSSNQNSDQGQNIVYSRRGLLYLLEVHLNTRNSHVDNLSLKVFDTDYCEDGSESCKIAMLDGLAYS